MMLGYDVASWCSVGRHLLFDRVVMAVGPMAVADA